MSTSLLAPIIAVHALAILLSIRYQPTTTAPPPPPRTRTRTEEEGREPRTFLPPPPLAAAGWLQASESAARLLEFRAARVERFAFGQVASVS
ncbi:hypothetical protein GUJ93_ZPchr0007g3243 [Zizania palustris]|uniref:Secreted protein n=1 Tax=Zizania palustris TaxID=103762 RepID=A0A8J5TIK6_ZIZPA|nr:hypothetical protein GUJ93_ZPchr0007g3243 [Zizania palustris]